MSKNQSTIAELQQELETVLTWFESDNIDLNEAADQYEKAQKIIQQIEKELKRAEVKIDKVKRQPKS